MSQPAANPPSRFTPRPLPLRRRAFACALLWLVGVIGAPILHAEAHVLESRQFDAELVRLAKLRANAPPPQPTEADLALLNGSALDWQEALFSSEDSVSPEVDAQFGPLIAFELRTAASREPRADAEPALHFHFHTHLGDPAPRKDERSHRPRGGDEQAHPFQHGQSSSAHSGIALHSAPALPASLLPAANETPIAAEPASTLRTIPSWHRPRCAQSPPA